MFLKGRGLTCSCLRKRYPGQAEREAEVARFGYRYICGNYYAQFIYW
jgi:hypothetical protein